MRAVIRNLTKRQLPEGYAVDVHFNPKYNPWDQRLCVVPDADLYRALGSGDASIVTDHIETFTEDGIRLRSGRQLEADIVVTATGLNLQAFGGVDVRIDGAEVRLPDTVAYKGLMLSGVPNFAFAIGYTNASWTLKVDLVCECLCRLIGQLDALGHDACVPELDGPVETRPLLNFQAGYVLRSLDAFPRQGDRAPWHLAMSYDTDVQTLRGGRIDDGTLRFLDARRPASDALRLAA
jgi:cation diffusion facilitator CzcD-associated flavoprotein CzcO